MKLYFTKMQAQGNDYVYMDAVHQVIEDPGRLAREVSDRHFGIGSDGLVLICPSDRADFRMRIFNPDGTEAEMCGNALRSTGKFVYMQGLTQKEELKIETLGGIKRVWLEVKEGMVENICAAIGRPEFTPEKIPVIVEGKYFLDMPLEVADRVFRASALSWGNAHVVLLAEDVSTLDIKKYGSLVEHMQCFPRRTNVTFARILDERHIRIREWERGTGETLACGTGCCSAAVVANRLGLCAQSVEVWQPGGQLQVDLDEREGVLMMGPVHFVYQGEYSENIVALET